MFDEVKLIEKLRYTGGRVIGYAEKVAKDQEILATHALVIEIVCHYGGPKYILRIHPVAKLNSATLGKMVLEALLAVYNAEGKTISCVCDNCKTNVSTYTKFGGPGKRMIDAIFSEVFLVFDNIHIFKNIRIGLRSATRSFRSKKVRKYSDIETLYQEDRKHIICLTKMTYTSVNPKPLQRRSVPFVCQIFNKTTVAALTTLQKKLDISEGTIIFVKLITDRFNMMNAKDRFSAINLWDECRHPWT